MTKRRAKRLPISPWNTCGKVIQSTMSKSLLFLDPIVMFSVCSMRIPSDFEQFSSLGFSKVGLLRALNKKAPLDAVEIQAPPPVATQSAASASTGSKGTLKLDESEQVDTEEGEEEKELVEDEEIEDVD